MPPKADKTPLGKTLGFRVTEEAYQVIADAMRKERRIESDVCRALVDRGIAAYQRDGKLFESDAEKDSSKDATKYKRVPVIKTGTR